MTATATPLGEAMAITRVTGAVTVPAELLPDCTCILGDCDRDHDNE